MADPYSRDAQFGDPEAWAGTFEWNPADIPGSIQSWTDLHGYAPSSSKDAYQDFLPVSYTHLTLPTNREV